MPELVERYLAAVARRIWVKGRKDILQELRGGLEDLLAERFGNRSPGEGELSDVLREFGHPSEVARRYNGDPGCLISSRVYPLYRMVAAIVMGAVTLGLTVAAVVGFVADPEVSGAMAVLRWLGTLFPGLLSAFGGVTLTFAILDRVAPEELEGEAAGPWDPRDLPAAGPAGEAVGPAGALAGLIFSLAGLGIFAFLSHLVSLGPGAGENLRFTQALFGGSVFFQLRYWWYGVFALGALENLLVLWRGSGWIPARLAGLAGSVYTALVLVLSLGSGVLLDGAGLAAALPEKAAEMLELAKVFRTMLRVGLILALLGMLYDILKRGYRLIRR